MRIWLDRNVSLLTFFLGALFGSMLLALSLHQFSGKTEAVDKSFETTRRLAFGLLSRSSVSDLETYREESVMNGPRYFYFRSADVNQFVRWLRLTPCKKIPSLYEELVKRAQSGVKWQFNWRTENVYFNVYDDFEHHDFAADMLLVDGDKVVLMMDGAFPNLKDAAKSPCSS